MNRYPVWKYAVIVIVLLVGIIYALPNFFGEAPAVQISAAKSVAKVDASTQERVRAALDAAGLKPDMLTLDATSIRARFNTPGEQLKARDVLQHALSPDADNADYVVALNLVSRSPNWLTALHAAPMYLGLDLRGGVHFMLQVDMKGALNKKAETFADDLRSTLRDKAVRGVMVSREGLSIQARAPDAATLARVSAIVQDQFPDLASTTGTSANGSLTLTATFRPEAARNTQDAALKQNITTLHNRINELGVAEPVIQQQGLDRIIVELPGVQDTAKAKEILGRTATLEMRMGDDSAEASAALNGGAVPFGSEKFLDTQGRPVIVKRRILATGENLADAQAGFDPQTQDPSVNLTLDAKGGRVIRDVSRVNIGKPMAIILFEKGKGQVISYATIRGELGSRFQISGQMSVSDASDLALLLRAGSLAAPMDIIEESTIGPSLGADNIRKGFHSVTWGFTAIVVFMCIYYMLFGVFSAIALGMNLLLLVAVLSMLQATLTLPGIAAMALAIGVAIDSNVLINERVREELRGGASPQAAIHAGYERAWATILDSNVTTLIAGIALLAFGSGPVRGFAVVHCVGIVTSMFSAVFFSRGLVNFWYGRKKKLKKVSIGTVWRPPAEAAAMAAASAQLNTNAALSASHPSRAPAPGTRPQTRK